MIKGISGGQKKRLTTGRWAKIVIQVITCKLYLKAHLADADLFDR